MNPCRGEHLKHIVREVGFESNTVDHMLNDHT